MRYVTLLFVNCNIMAGKLLFIEVQSGVVYDFGCSFRVNRILSSLQPLH